jgi:hypothetical protein
VAGLDPPAPCCFLDAHQSFTTEVQVLVELFPGKAGMLDRREQESQVRRPLSND